MICFPYIIYKDTIIDFVDLFGIITTIIIISGLVLTSTKNPRIIYFLDVS